MDNTGGYAEAAFVAELYDSVPLHETRPDIDFYLEYARDSGGPVLELGCGTGRILIPIVKAGIEIAGLDLSEPMLDVCQKKLAEQPTEVQTRASVVLIDMRQFDLNRQFTLVTTPFRSFQHLLTVEDQLSCLASVHRHLVDGGRLILDLFNPHLPYLVDSSRTEEFGDEPPFTLPDGSHVIRKSRLWNMDHARQCFNSEMAYYITRPDGKQERLAHQFAMRYLFRYEAEHLLERAGFSVEEVFGGFDRCDFGSRNPGELILVARKRA